MIASRSNARVRLLRSLQTGKGRERSGLFLLEGVRLAEEVSAAQITPVMVLYDEERMRRSERSATILDALTRRSDWAEAATPEVLSSVSDVQHSQGIIVAVRSDFEEATQEAPIPGNLDDLTVILDGLADPGNAGTILRTAWATGVRRIVVMPNSVDLYNPKVVRAAAGAHLHLALTHHGNWRQWEEHLDADRSARLVLTEARATRAYWRFDWTKPAALIVGNEAYGAGPTPRRLATHRVRIPMPGGGESLNAAMAVGVILYEAMRQRAIRALRQGEA